MAEITRQGRRWRKCFFWQSMGVLALPVFPGAAALYLGKNLGIIIGIGKSGFFSSYADGFFLTKIL